MCKIVLRIQEIAVAEGITIGALERKIGASKGVLSRAINNGMDIQSKWLESLVDNYPLLSPVWLLTGTGEMYVHVKGAEPKPIQDDIPPSILQNFMTTIQEQAEEIGRLREQVRQLKQERGGRCIGCNHFHSCKCRVNRTMELIICNPKR